MSTQSGKPSQYFRRSGEAIGMAILLGVVIVVIPFLPGPEERLERLRPFLPYFKGLAFGYALGRTHQLLDQLWYHSDPREPKGK